MSVAPSVISVGRGHAVGAGVNMGRATGTVSSCRCPAVAPVCIGTGI